MMSAMTETAFMRDMILARSGDRETPVTLMGEEEFRLFYERTARPLWAYLSRLTGDRQKADDYLQEAYYRFYRAGAHHVDEKHRRNSLFQIATNIARDAARRNARYPEVPLEVDMPGTEDKVALRTDIQRGLAQLQPAQREILWLAYAQGASHDEIAEIIGVRSISVRTLLRRARLKLAGILKEGRR